MLVLNRNWQAINSTTPALAFCQMATDVASGLDIHGQDHMIPTRWKDWLLLPVRDEDNSVGTSSGRIRVPTVIVLARFDRVPLKHPKFSARALWERNRGRCQYTGKPLAPDEGNIDHIVPRSRGGATTWTNCVIADLIANLHQQNSQAIFPGSVATVRPVAVVGSVLHEKRIAGCKEQLSQFRVL